MAAATSASGSLVRAARRAVPGWLHDPGRHLQTLSRILELAVAVEGRALNPSRAAFLFSGDFQVIDQPTRYRCVLKCAEQSSIRDERIYEDDGEPPPEQAVLEITVVRERMKVRVVSVHWPDRNTPAEITVEQIK